MNKEIKARQEYLTKLNTVVEYINNNLDKKISIATLAQISNLSPFHFHRIMKSLLGESIGNYITRTRVETATLLIRYTNLEIQDIAYQVGYEKPSSLNKIFKQYYNISPSEYRVNKKLKINRSIIHKTNFELEEPQILEIPNKEVIYIQIIGEYGNENYNKVWDELGNFVKEKKLFSTGMESFGISYDDPSVTKKEKCRYEACITVNKPVVPHGKIGIKKIKGGKFAVFNYCGNYKNWGKIYDYIYDNWLINSDYDLRNFPVMEKYLSTTKQNDHTILNLEIYLPIKEYDKIETI